MDRTSAPRGRPRPCLRSSCPNDKNWAIVGRWRACGDPALDAATPHNVVEFGVKRRFRFYMDDGGDLTQTATGLYYMLARGQPVLRNFGPNAVSRSLAFDDRYQIFRVEGQFYARIDAPPDVGLDIPPPISDGTCNLVGTWDTVDADPRVGPGTFEFRRPRLRRSHSSQPSGPLLPASKPRVAQFRPALARYSEQLCAAARESCLSPSDEFLKGPAA